MLPRVKIVGFLSLSLLWLALSGCGGKSQSQPYITVDKSPQQSKIESSTLGQQEDEPQKADIHVLRSLLRTLDLSNLSSSGLQDSLGVNGHIRQLATTLLKPGLSNLQQLLISGKSSSSVELTKTCKLGGDVLMTGILAGDRISAGDQLTVDFSRCKDTTRQTNGSVTMTMLDETAESGIGTPEFSIGLEFADYAVISNKSVVLNGHSILSQNHYKRAKVVKLQGDSLSLQTDTGSLGLVNYDISEFADSRSQLSSFTLSGAVYADNLVGGFNVDTLEAFVQSAWDPYPNQGVMLIEAIENQSSLLLTVLDNTNIQLELDSDGDGEIDETVITTWQQAFPPYAFL